MRQTQDFTRTDGLLIQQSQLAQWKTVLNENAYHQLRNWVKSQNRKLLPGASGYDVVRGNDLDTFIVNLARKLHTNS